MITLSNITKEHLPLVLTELCASYLTQYENFYYENTWDKINSFSFSFSVCDIAAANGWLDLFEWGDSNIDLLYKYKHSKACSIAALNGYLDILKLAYNKGHPITSWAYSNAAVNGHLDILKWLKMNILQTQAQAKWDDTTCCNAVRSKNTEMIEWLSKNNCPCRGEYHNI